MIFDAACITLRVIDLEGSKELTRQALLVMTSNGAMPGDEPDKADCCGSGLRALKCLRPTLQQQQGNDVCWEEQHRRILPRGG